MRDPSGDQIGRDVGAVLRHQVADRAVGDRDDRDVRRAGAGGAAVHAMIERDRAAVRRPVETAHDERAGGQLTNRLRGDVDDEEVRHPMFLIDDLELAVLLVAVLEGGRLRLRRRVRDARAVRRPREAVHAVFQRRERLGFAAARADQINLPLVGPIGGERELRSVGRPGGGVARLFRVGQLARRAGPGVGQPDLRVVRVVVPVGLADRIRHQKAVG